MSETGKPPRFSTQVPRGTVVRLGTAEIEFASNAKIHVRGAPHIVVAYPDGRTITRDSGEREDA